MARRIRGVLITGLTLYFTLLGGTTVTNVLLWPRIVHQALLTLLLAGWLVALLVRRRPFPATPLDGPILAYSVVYAVSTLFALDTRISVEMLWEMGTHILMFYLLVDVMRTYRPGVIFRSMFFTYAVVVIVGVFRLGTWYFGWQSSIPGWFEIGGLRDPFPPVIYRVGIPPAVATEIAGYLAMWIPVGLAWAVATHSGQTRQALLVWLIGVLFMTGLTFSRGGLLSLVVSVPTFCFLFLVGNWPRRDRVLAMLADARVRVALAAVILAVMAALAVGTVRLGALRERLTGDSYLSGDAVRWDLWHSAWRMGFQDPLTGVGPYGYGRALRWLRTPELARDHMMRPHNLPLLVWAEAGLPGVLALAWMVGVAVWVGFRRWKQAVGAERIRLAGVCAGLLGIAAHNVVDALIFTPNLLPVFVLVAFLVFPLERNRDRAPRVYRALPPVLLGVMGMALIGWFFSHRAYYFAVQANRLEASGDMESALEAIDMARQLDPSLGLYAAQRARYLGRLAAGDGSYLPVALAAYEEVFAYEDSNDVMHANYAYLLAQAGDIETAFEEMQVAAAIFPHDPRYFLWVGEYAEALGAEAQARQAYLQALENRPGRAVSAYWDLTPLRSEVRAAFLDAQGLADVPPAHLQAVSPDCWPYLVDDPPSSDAGLARLCEAEIALRVTGDPAEALGLLDEAVQADRSRGRLYVLRAEAGLAQGDLSLAGRDARTALFLDEWGGYMVLGRLAELEGDLPAAARAYGRILPGVLLRPAYAFAVYSRRDIDLLLPGLVAPAPDPSQLVPFQALVRVYDALGDVESAQRVYDAMLAYDPYAVLGE